jgi:molybdopterin/thiamine biosynthesis adenylyltransferase
LKTRIVRDLILEKNPEAQVSEHAIGISPDTLEAITPLVREADVVICATDNRPSKLLINQLCLENNVVALYGGAFRRAYGGQVLRVRPGQSPCHQCFIAVMPEEAADVEISSTSEAEAVAYSDRPVAVEPGLSLDVLPIATFLAKLALLELLVGKTTSLDTLRRDFDAPWYLWLNRPEPGTQYAAWPPLSESSDEMTINRWYGIYFDRDAGCPACGDFTTAQAIAYGVDLRSVSLPAPPAKD